MGLVNTTQAQTNDQVLTRVNGGASWQDPVTYTEGLGITIGANNAISITNTATDGQVLTSFGTGLIRWETPANEDITRVRAGNGLIDGGMVGDVILNVVAENGLTTRADEIVLGGELNEATPITFGGNTMTFNLSGAGDFVIQDNGTTFFTADGDGDVVINDAGDEFHDFRVESDNEDHMLYMDASLNRIGIGTDGPDADLHIDGIGETGPILSNMKTITNNADDAPLITFRNARTDGTGEDPRTLVNNDLIGELNFEGYTGSTYRVGGGILMKADNTVTAASLPTRMEFHTQSAGGVGGFSRMYLSRAGRLYIGTGTGTVPTFHLEVSENSAAKPISSVWTISSDSRLKTVHGSYEKGLSEITELNTITYNYKNVEDKTFEQSVLDELGIGFVAQEVREVFPECVKEMEDGYLSLNVHAINVAYVNAFKELSAKNQELEKQLLKVTEVLKKAGVSLE